MRVLIDSYNTVTQNGGGGVQMRINKMYEYLNCNPSLSKVKLFDKWSDKVADYDILHIFKDSIDNINQMSYAKQSGLKIVLSSVIPQMQSFRIRTAFLMQRISRINNTYSLLRRGIELSDAVIAQTDQEACFISKIFGGDKSKIHVIPNGVREELLENYKLEAKRDIILCVGRFDHNKNQISLIRALKGSGLPLHFVGGATPDDKSYYEECVKLAETDKDIIFHGWLSNDSKELIDLYKRAKVVALISHREIFGNSLIEGAAAGANLVASACLPTHEWGFDTHCVRVNPKSVVDIRKGVESAYNMPFSPEIHRRTVELFSWSSVVKRYVDIYQSLLK